MFWLSVEIKRLKSSMLGGSYWSVISTSGTLQKQNKELCQDIISNICQAPFSMSAPSTAKENQVDMVNIKARFPVKNKYKFSVGTN